LSREREREMGLFVLPLGDTAQKNVREAEGNLKLWWENPTDVRNAYLIQVAIHCLEEAKKKIANTPSSPS
jgi:hypothetical protein